MQQLVTRMKRTLTRKPITTKNFLSDIIVDEFEPDACPPKAD